MRILYCNKYNFAFSGTEAYLFSAMEMMRQRGHETALFAMADPRGDPTAYDRYFVAHRGFQHAKGALNRVRLAAHAIYSVEARRKLRALIKHFRPDVAHVRNIYHHLSPSILWELKAKGIPVVYHLNDFKLLCPSYNMVSGGKPCEACKGRRFVNAVREGCYAGGRSKSVVLALEAYVHRWLRTYEECVDLFLAPSHFVKNKLVEHGWSESRIQVLPHFQDVSADAQPHPGTTGGALYFGRLSAEKGVEDLLQAAAEVPDLNVVIAGDGPLRRELENRVRAASLRNVHFVGHVSGPALEELIAQSQFTVFPSHAYETFGKSILESYAHARPVTASDLGSRRELVHNGETGILYPAGDTAQLAAAMKFLMARPELVREMGNAGLRLVRDQFSPENHCEALLQVYKSLIRAPQTISPELTQRCLRVAFIGGRGVIGKYSGVESFYEKAGHALATRGHEITAYCRTYFTPDQAEHAGIRIVRLPTIHTKHLDTFVHSLLSTFHACFGNYDIVHYHTLGPSLFAFLPRLFGEKTVVTVQGLDWQRKKWSRLARLVLKMGEWTSAHFPNRTIVVSHTLDQYYRERHHCSVTYIPNGTDAMARVARAHLAAYGFQPDNYVLFLGRFSPEKNLDLLLQAFEAVNTPMKLVLAGGSSHTDKYVQQLRSHASERIRFLNWLSGPALQQVLTNAALFVLPSDMEGMSLALLDAMGAGVCVLASDVPENCEVIGDAGFTFRAGNTLDLQRMLRTLLSNAELRHRTGELARGRIRKEFLWSRVVDDLERVYAEVAGEPLLVAKPESMRKVA